jgi:hypothetical protein
MPGPSKRYYVLAAIGVVCATLASVYAWRPHDYSHLVLRVGTRNNSLSHRRVSKAAWDLLAVEVLATAVSRLGLPRNGFEPPSGKIKRV